MYKTSGTSGPRIGRVIFLDGNGDYLQMHCVESGNVGENRLVLPPGQTSSLKVTFSTSPLRHETLS